MTKAAASALVVLLWAAIYLPGLGTLHIRGEEGRRILPAIAMLESSEVRAWIVPQIGGEDYFRKPPLLNWLIAATFKATGVRDELAARLPSVLSVLALGLVTVGVASGWLGASGALTAAIFMIAHIGMIDKGRLAEIEALYISLTGIAIVCWLSWCVRGASPWLMWTVPSVFLGLALLAKGPLHLLYFYGIAGAVLWCQRRQGGKARYSLLSVPHLAGVLMMAAIFAAWAVPYFREVSAAAAAGVWQDQFLGPAGVTHFNLGHWLLKFPRAIGNYLPWVLLTPVLFMPGVEKSLRVDEVAMFRGVRATAIALFFGVLLLPAVLPRYVQPLLVPMSLLLALVLVRQEWPRTIFAWRRVNTAVAMLLLGAALAMPFVTTLTLWRFAVALFLAAVVLIVALPSPRTEGSAAVRSAVLIGVAMAIVAVGVLPRVRAESVVLAVAEEINGAVPENQPLYVLSGTFLHALFYVRPQVKYVPEMAETPEEAHLLVRSQARRRVDAIWPAVEVVAEFVDRDGKKYQVVRAREE